MQTMTPHLKQTGWMNEKFLAYDLEQANQREKNTKRDEDIAILQTQAAAQIASAKVMDGKLTTLQKTIDQDLATLKASVAKASARPPTP